MQHAAQFEYLPFQQTDHWQSYLRHLKIGSRAFVATKHAVYHLVFCLNGIHAFPVPLHMLRRFGFVEVDASAWRFEQEQGIQGFLPSVYLLYSHIGIGKIYALIESVHHHTALHSLPEHQDVEYLLVETLIHKAPFLVLEIIQLIVVISLREEVE